MIKYSELQRNTILLHNVRCDSVLAESLLPPKDAPGSDFSGAGDELMVYVFSLKSCSISSPMRSIQYLIDQT